MFTVLVDLIYQAAQLQEKDEQVATLSKKLAKAKEKQKHAMAKSYKHHADIVAKLQKDHRELKDEALSVSVGGQ